MTTGETSLLRVADLVLGAAAGVAIRGEVELATAPELTAALDQAIRRTSGPFVVDLAAVDFLDSCGISCLVRARARLARDDRPLALICPPSQPRRTLELTGVDELVPIHDSREELLRALK
jgi:anti-sigma B factor antagonist